MSQTIKALTHLSIIPKYHNYSVLRHLCYGKDLIRATSAVQSPDYLLQNLKNSQDVKHVLQIVGEHHKIMNTKHIVQALQTIFDLQKGGSSDFSAKDIVRHQEFDNLCKKLNSQFGTLDPLDAINALKVLSYLRVPSSSKIVQVLLQIVRENINNLGLPNLVFLNFLLEGFRSTPLVDALKIAVPIVFSVQFPKKVDKRNLAQLTEYLYFSTLLNVSHDTLEELVQILTTHEEQFSAKVAKDIVWALCNVRAHEVFAPLLKRALNDLIIHIDELDFNEMETTLSKLVSNYSRKHPYYYNEVFCESCVNYLIDKDCGFKEALYIARKLGRVRHHNRYLLDYIARKAHDDPSLLESMYSVDVYGLVIEAYLTDYRPPHWEILKDHIQSMRNLAADDKKEFIWIRYATSLCLLDIYKIDVLGKALNPKYLEKLLKVSCFNSDFENYFAIWQCLKFRRKELLDLIPAGFDPVDVVDYMREFVTHPLKESLERGIGGEEFVRTRIFSKSGVRIDHAILFRKGGYPIQIDKEIKFVEDISVQPDQQLILMLSLDPIMYTINTKMLRQTTVLSIKILEEKGFNVVPISVEIWEGLNEFEKIPYLMQAIKNKLNNDYRISESVI